MSLSIYGTGVPFARLLSGRFPDGMSYTVDASGIRFRGRPTNCGRFVSIWNGPYPNPSLWQPHTFRCRDTQLAGWVWAECALGGCHEGIGHVAIGGNISTNRNGKYLFNGKPISGSKLLIPQVYGDTEWYLWFAYTNFDHCCERATFNFYQQAYCETEGNLIGGGNVNNVNVAPASARCPHVLPVIPPEYDFPAPYRAGATDIISGGLFQPFTFSCAGTPDECIKPTCPVFRNVINGSLMEYCATTKFAVIINVPCVGGQQPIYDPLPVVGVDVDYISESEVLSSPVSWGKAFRSLREVPTAYVRRSAWPATRQIKIDYLRKGTNKNFSAWETPVADNQRAGILFRNEASTLVDSSLITAEDYIKGDWQVFGASPNAEIEPENTLITVNEDIVKAEEIDGDIVVTTPFIDGDKNKSAINFSIPVPAGDREGQGGWFNANSLFYLPYNPEQIERNIRWVVIEEQNESEEFWNVPAKILFKTSETFHDPALVALLNSSVGQTGGTDVKAIPRKFWKSVSEARTAFFGISAPPRSHPSFIVISAVVYLKPNFETGA